MMRLSGKLTPDLFEALLREYQRLLRRLFEEMGGREVAVSGDSALAAFPLRRKPRLRQLRPNGRSQSTNGPRTETCGQRRAPFRRGRNRLGHLGGSALF
jgi:class 3 adenylate cyclase